MISGPIGDPVRINFVLAINWIGLHEQTTKSGPIVRSFINNITSNKYHHFKIKIFQIFADGEDELGAKAKRLNPHPNKPNNHTTPPLPAIHSHTNSVLPQLGLPTTPLPPILHRRRSLIPTAAHEMGLLSGPQKGP